MRLRPFFAYPSSYSQKTKRTRLVFGFGITSGSRAIYGVWLWRDRRLCRRSHGPQGTMREHWRLSKHRLEFQVGRKCFTFVLEPRPRLRFEVVQLGV